MLALADQPAWSNQPSLDQGEMLSQETNVDGS